MAPIPRSITEYAMCFSVKDSIVAEQYAEHLGAIIPYEREEYDS